MEDTIQPMSIFKTVVGAGTSGLTLTTESEFEKVHNVCTSVRSWMLEPVPPESDLYLRTAFFLGLS